MTSAAGNTTVLTIDPSHSTVEFSVKHMMFTTVKGTAAIKSGEIVVDNANIANSSVMVVIDAASIRTGDEKRDGHLASPDFFDVANHPEITFVSTLVARDGDDLSVTGNLTMHGVTKQVVLEAEYEGEGVNPWGAAVVGYSAETKINREDFGLTWNVALESGGVLVSKDVKLSMEIQAARQ